MTVIWMRFFDDLKNPAVLMLDSCDIKPVMFLNIHQKTKVLKHPLTVLLDTRAQYNCIEAESSHLAKIQR